jgi:hypothetical protein
VTIPGVTPAPPDARRDPFGAMSAAVAPVAQHHAPYPHFVDDGVPVENVSRGSRASLFIFGFAVLLVGGGLGYWWGGIVVDRKMYNRMVDDAGSIKGEVDAMAKRLSTIVDALNNNGRRAPTGAPDFDLVRTFKEMDLTPPDQQRLFRTNYARLEDIAIDELFNYYNDTINLYEQIKRHVAMSEKEKDLLDAFARDAKALDVNYGVTLEPGKVMVAKLVQIIETICKGGKKDCQNINELDGFMVAQGPGATPFAAKISGNGLRVVPIEHSQMFDSMVAGAKPEALAGQDYKRRLAQIRLLSQKLFQSQKSLLAHLDGVAKQPKLFTF